jgi:hypothetical protein
MGLGGVGTSNIAEPLCSSSTSAGRLDGVAVTFPDRFTRHGQRPHLLQAVLWSPTHRLGTANQECLGDCCLCRVILKPCGRRDSWCGTGHCVEKACHHLCRQGSRRFVQRLSKVSGWSKERRLLLLLLLLLSLLWWWLRRQ